MTEISSIGSNGVPGLERLAAYEVKPTPDQVPLRREAQPDRVEVSEVAEFRAKLAALPAVREDLVSRVQAQIEAGDYDSAERVESAVEKLFEEESAFLFA